MRSLMLVFLAVMTSSPLRADVDYQSYPTGDIGYTQIGTRAQSVEKGIAAIDDESEKRELKTHFAEAKKSYAAKDFASTGRILSYLAERLSARGMNMQPSARLSDEQKKGLSSIGKEMHTAMKNEDMRTINNLVKRTVTLLGSEAGKPEAGLLIRKNAPRFSGNVEAEAKRLLDTRRSAMLDAGTRVAVSIRKKDKLRIAAGLLLELSALIAASSMDESAPLIPELCTAADALVSVQGANGIFGIPYDNASSDLLIKRASLAVDEAKRNSARIIIERGWILDDSGALDGGLQFDNGLAARAVVLAYRTQSDERYLAAAKRSRDALERTPVCPNWNYNAFSISFLAELYRAAPEERTRTILAKKLTYGLIPGLMVNGRYADPHNAKTVYHHIITEALLDAAEALPRSDELSASVIDAAARASLSAADEIIAIGPVHADRAVGMLSRANLLRADDRFGHSLSITLGELSAAGNEQMANAFYLRHLIAPVR